MYFKIFISESWDKRLGISPKIVFRGARHTIFSFQCFSPLRWGCCRRNAPSAILPFHDTVFLPFVPTLPPILGWEQIRFSATATTAVWGKVWDCHILR